MAALESTRWNRKILLAVDDSDNSRRAVQYVGFLLGEQSDAHVTLLHVIPEPEEDYFPDETQRAQWLQGYRERLEGVLEGYFQMLRADGFKPQNLAKRLFTRHCPSMAECILAERRRGSYGTIVVGRQGLSRKEEFLFGSISSKIVNHASHCTVWVVE